MLSHLLNVEVNIFDTQTHHDGLGQTIDAFEKRETVKARIRQLSAREQYSTQGQDEVSTHRIYILGKKSDHPYIVRENIIMDCDDRYKIQTIEQGKTAQSSHHIQVDCIKVLGV